jgi:integrase
MPRVRLSKGTIDGLPSAPKDTVYWDAGLPAFGVKVTPKGRKVFVVLYRVAGAGSRLRKYTIGPYGKVTLAMARAQAQKIFAARLEGRDPAAEKREARRKIVVDRVDDLLEAFIQQRVSSLRSARAVSNRLRREIGARWAGKSIHDIKKRDVVDLVTEISIRSAGVAHETLKLLNAFLRWCVGRGVIDFSPAEGVQSYWREKSRSRVLGDPELGAILRAARDFVFPYGAIVELLALTGQRREEVAQMKWDEIDGASLTWCIPAERSKNGRAHVVHLSEEALEVIRRCPRRNALVFATLRGNRAQDFGKHKARLDQLSGVTDWWLHDLRRTLVSGLARLGVPPHVADKILNHQSGTISGVAAVYQRHEFLAERKQALEIWGNHVRTLLSAKPAITGASCQDVLLP